MKLEEFLARVVPPGNFIITSRIGGPQKRPWYDQTHPNIGRAGWSLRRDIAQGYEVYHALGAFTQAVNMVSRAGNNYSSAPRRQNNVQHIKTLVIDADVARPGDGKDPATVFPDRSAAAVWLQTFVNTIGLPAPNLAVNSGYGFHWYWLLDTPLAPVDWQPLANALKAAMLANGWVGDTVSTVDCARVLRPPESNNLKSGQPMPVSVYPKMTAADYPVSVLETALQPWIAATYAQAATGTSNPSATVTNLGPRPAHITPGSVPPLNANAHVGIDRREYLFARIATQCEQVKQSLAVNGLGDKYPLWYLGHLTLAHHCHDGHDFVHEISKGHAAYKPDDTDAAVARVANEVRDKNIGAPLCSSYDSNRPGVCPTCPWYKIRTSPYSLGIEDGDLPNGWRRNTANHTLERYADKEWRFVIDGDFRMPQLEAIPTGGYALQFEYEDTGKKIHPVRVSGVEAINRNEVGQLLARQGIQVSRHNAAVMGDFVVAWLNKLRALRVQHSDSVKPFGWSYDIEGKRIGASIAGTLYRTDGTDTVIPGGDPEIRHKFTPMGNIQPWRDAAKLFEHGRVDMQVLIATTFGAPLMTFTGIRGLVWNFWSQGSGVGKTSAMKIANAVWGAPSAMQSNADTPNAVLHLLSETRILAKLWDELRVQKDWQGAFVELLFTVPQGKERARMAPDTTLRPVGEWNTMVVFTCNRSIMDYILQEAGSTDAGVARAFECFLPPMGKRYSSTADQTIAAVETNYGHAGRDYIKYVSANADKIQAAINNIKDTLDQKLKPEDVERFYIAGIAAVIVGARVATRLKLFDFDVLGMQAYLERVFLELRAGRAGQTLMTPSGTFDIEQLLGQFVARHADQKIITEHFVGSNRASVRVLAPPRGNEVRIQLVDAAKIMRVDRKSLRDFFHTHNASGGNLIKQMQADWGATEHRATLAGGTQFSVGPMWVIDIPLAAGNLMSYLTPSPKAAPANAAPASPARPSPARQLAGNQPTV